MAKLKSPRVLFAAQMHIRQRTELNFLRRETVTKPKWGEMYFTLPKVGEIGWVHGQRLIYISTKAGKYIMQHPETGKQVIVVTPLKRIKQN